MKKSFFFFLKVGVSLLLVYWLILHVDWSVVVDKLLSLSLPLVFLYILFQLLGNLISAKKWQFLSHWQGFSFSVRDGFFAYLTGAFINNFLPGTIGGDAYRTLWLGRNGERWKAFSVVFFDRASGLLALFVCAMIGFFVLPLSLWQSSPWLILLAFFTFFVLVLTLSSFLYTYGVFEMLILIAGWLPSSRPVNFIRRFEVFADQAIYARAIGYALLFTLVGVAFNNYALFLALGADIHFVPFTGVIFLATLVSSIPLSINNIGIKEWAYITFFGLAGVSPEIAVTAALLSRFLQMLLSFIAVPFYLGQRKIAPSGEMDIVK
ncbi:MAG: lysylphosphatidylglycerol synthase transmembrane domain-containing protein [Candidatus Moraniibacteriota bacterium]